MATANPAQSLQHETTCSICLDYFQDPVMVTDCGHNFCRACITNYRKGSATSVSCPQCRQVFPWKNLKPNRHLGNIVEAVKPLSLQLESHIKRETVCREHHKPLNRFCEKDEALICKVCERSKPHRNHTVIDTEVATAQYKVKLFKHLEKLKKERSLIQSVKSSGEKPSQELLRKTQTKRQEIEYEFQQQQQFLEEQKQFQLARLGDMEKEIEKTKDDYACKFEDEITYLTDLIDEMQKKDGQPANEFLQNIGGLVDRCEQWQFQFPDVPNISNVEKKLKEFSQECASLENYMRKFKELLVKPKWIKENVLLDPETAHPRYIVSADCKTVKWGKARQDLPYSPKRFECTRCVLGCQGFASGKHYWTVDVEDGDYWVVGVVRESVDREEELEFDPDEGVWVLGLYNDQYKALTVPPIVLDVEDDPVEIQVSLNYEAGTVAFYDAEDKTCLHVFRSADFRGEKVFPFFRIGGSSTVLQMCS